MRFIYYAALLCLFTLLLPLPGFTDDATAPEPTLVYSLTVPTTLNLSQATAVSIEAYPLKHATGIDFPDTVTLTTDLGYFAGSDAQEVSLKKNEHRLYEQAKLCFDKLTIAPTTPCHISLITMGKEIAQATITLRRATTIGYGNMPRSIPVGEKAEPWVISWYVYDQFHKPLPGVPGIVSYTLPGSPTTDVAGISDESGLLQVKLPPAVCEGECTARLVTATCSSEPYRFETSRDRGRLLPNLVATLAVPEHIDSLTQENIPVLISVSSKDGSPLPETLTIWVQNKKLSMSLQDGKGTFMLSLRDIAPFGNPLPIVAVVDEPSHNGEMESRIIGQVRIPVNIYPTDMRLHVTPLAQRAKNDPIGTLTITLENGERPYAHFPLRICSAGIRYAMVETDEQGKVTYAIPADDIIWTIAVQAGYAPGFTYYVHLQQDDYGRLTAWGFLTDGEFQAEETITYDKAGNPTVTVAEKKE